MLGAPTLQENYNHNMTKMLGILKFREEHTHDPNDNCVVSLSLQQTRSMTTFAGASADQSDSFRDVLSVRHSSFTTILKLAIV